MHGYINEQLDKVLLLRKQWTLELNRVSNKRTKKVGLAMLTISPEEKMMNYQKIHDRYRTSIAVVYDDINEKLREAGQQELINPFGRNVTKNEAISENSATD